MKISRLPRDTGVSGWNGILSNRPVRDPLTQNIGVDFLVIGAGFTGLSAACRLQDNHPQAKIALLEAGDIASGPVGRNSGFMIDLPHDLASEDYAGSENDINKIKLNRRGIGFAKQLFEKFEMPAETFDPCGKINGAATQKGLSHNRDYAAHLSSLNEASMSLDAKQMRDVTGSDYYHGGLFTAGTVLLQPALWAQELAEGLTNKTKIPMRLFERSPVVALKREGANWLANTPSGSVEAQKVILAVNGHGESFGYYKRRLVHVMLYASMTAPLTKEDFAGLGGDNKWGITPADPMGTTVRRLTGPGGDRIIIRNQASYAPTMEASATQVARMGRAHDHSFHARFPNLTNVKMQYRWAGRLCLSLNGAPAFGEVEENLISACCQNGLGATNGTLSGMLAADMACGMTSQDLTRFTALGNPNRLPPEPIASIGGKATLAWRQFRAGREV